LGEAERYPDDLPYSWLLAKLRQIGLDAYTHNYTLNYPMGLGTVSKPIAQLLDRISDMRISFNIDTNILMLKCHKASTWTCSDSNQTQLTECGYKILLPPCTVGN
jgi:hypothetical protein